MKKIFFGVLPLLLVFGFASAEVRSGKCPFSCKSNGYTRKNCKDWKKGKRCYIEVAGSRKKKVDARPCPHSCKSMGIKKRFCKDWRKGDMCYVQDLR